MPNDRLTCTPENPRTDERDIPGSRWEHAKVREVGEQENGYPGGDIVTYECKTCGERWRAELPQ